MRALSRPACKTSDTTANDLMNNTFDSVDVVGWEHHVEYLHKYLYDNADSKCLLWVNPAQVDSFAENERVQEARVRVPINHPRFDVSVGPYLVPLNLSASADADIFRDSVKFAWDAWDINSLHSLAGQPIGGWVVSKSDAKALAAHWAMRCHVHRRSDLTKFLRFHDPSVREWLWKSLNAVQRRALLGPASSIFSIGRGLNLINQHCETSSSALQVDSFAALVLSDGQWHQVEDYATVHAAWLAWIEAHEDGATVNQQCGWEQAIFGALAHATDYGIVDAQDRELFARHALQLDADFHSSKKMLPVWIRTRMGEYYGTVLGQVFCLQVDQFNTKLLNAS